MLFIIQNSAFLTELLLEGVKISAGCQIASKTLNTVHFYYIYFNAVDYLGYVRGPEGEYILVRASVISKFTSSYNGCSEKIKSASSIFTVV